ncbi:MAG: histidinol-phosphate transaminase [Caulobacteraceae bacterium]
MTDIIDKPTTTPIGRPPFRATLDTVEPYKAGMSLAEAARRHGRDDFVKLASNENLFGASPLAYEAARAVPSLELYPDPNCDALRQAIGGRVGVDPARVSVGPGSESQIDLLMRGILEPGDTVQISAPTFPLYAIVGDAIGVAYVDVPRLPDFALDVDGTIAALAAKPKLLILCTPNNPTGNAIAGADIARILAATSHDTVVLFDEAYHEFNDACDAIKLLEAWGGHWLLTRTFSKAYGLAGMRVGYGVGSSAEMIDFIDRIRPAFNVTAPSQAAALAAWNDEAHLAYVVGETRAERERIEQWLSERQIRHTTSKGNFVFIESRAPMLEATDRLLAEGVIVRPIPVPGTPGWLRITIGRREDNDRMLAALAGAIAQAS